MSPIKKKIRDALLAADFEKLAQMALDDRKVFSILISFTYDKEETLCWRAIEATGRAAAAAAEEDPSIVRTIVQRLLWSLRDESGGIAWSAPEMLGEIVINCPAICADIPPIIFSFHEEEVFLRGVLWAIGRIINSGKVDAENVDGIFDVVFRALSHGDPTVRGLALYAARGSIGKSAKINNKIKSMANDKGLYRIYLDHKLVEMTVGDEARKVVECRSA
ncbi:MAG TPA: hypothetical protein VN328_12255 [Thermodesulfovibrionales bacterium]|nr:hypothetical protein [Thermodesulfovibrionales bacterium]